MESLPASLQPGWVELKRPANMDHGASALTSLLCVLQNGVIRLLKNPITGSYKQLACLYLKHDLKYVLNFWFNS